MARLTDLQHEIHYMPNTMEHIHVFSIEGIELQHKTRSKELCGIDWAFINMELDRRLTEKDKAN